jgi:type IV secretory pathway TrbD component
MNRPGLIPIIGLAPMVAVLSVGVSLVLGLLWSWLIALALFPSAIYAGRRMNKVDPKFIHLFFLSLSLGTEYDPTLMEHLRDFPEVD